MAKVESIVPFILKWETGTTGATLTNEQLFEKAKKRRGYDVRRYVGNLYGILP